MRIVSLIRDAQIVERILRHVGMWVSEVCNQGVRILPFVLQHRIFTLIARNRSFTVDLSRARSRRWKSEFLSKNSIFWIFKLSGNLTLHKQ